ncbi:MAG: type VI secretion system baseplate subunit TssE [Planctomycetota bacterium]
MSRLDLTEQLQPSLLDRLTNDTPDKTVESREARVISVRRLREYVLRDLNWLLNAGNLDTQGTAKDMPRVLSSVLNYGVRDLTGRTETGVRPEDLSALIREAIERFEPRILPGSVKVHWKGSKGSDSPGNHMVFEIEGELWAQPIPERLFLETDVDLDSGQYIVRRREG